ncbi:sensor histidine kinase [Nodularia spumigena]|uniref:sensor histidine kinase n=1 Tax=Nodularia spumigena TaxID=70799 RepID=UPI00232C5C20|nr:HAMP domain-containing sensor histidine kinase [Nodularia spumigena]MDB9319890.1 HAMP domain-containing sensor histidine kinase [Nodularia spumigena CS-590/01A]MDB9320639.1 HAMP domain-containing sensor histidine kinase [Nodularia spumigena CS-591/07A]MDB9327743.1 HAMP domain-containing sensor histidine kinase [Nodularia spumigena CS-590/02]MDB9330142.1 HAMP domain-containing sensor histidine kinase [Nodularia spumigena CS-591/04]MDB9334599.1 HAMP domain-containing sensor histidine kinase [
MYQWILPSLSEILAESQATVAECSPTKAEQQWRVSLAATEKLLINILASASPDATQGLVLAAPAPLFSQPTLTQRLQTVTFTAKPFNPLALMPFRMPSAIAVANKQTVSHESVLPLLPADPLVTERFCLVFTDKFRLVLVLKEDKTGDKAFSFSFDPEVVQQAWRALGARVMLSNPEFFAELDTLVKNYSPVAPDYRTIIQFSQLLLQELTEPEANKEVSENSGGCGHKTEPQTKSPIPDVELLQAFAHEVRTPLTTIRTLTRLLLKRRDLPANVTNRLEIIDHECTEQIDRMELLFKAAELETSPPVKSLSTQLTAMSLDQVLRQSVPRWQQAAHRRNLTLDVILPQQLPTVVSNPNMLDQILTGLMENFTRSLPPGSHIQVQVIPAGDQLKLQLSPQFHCQGSSPSDGNVTPPIRKALGQLLMFQPETGTISLNIAATKHLFQAIGGKLIVRQRQHYGEVLTIFLPLEVTSKQKIKCTNLTPNPSP